ncbi:uncharacterized protein I303_104036 [Kwoniella dejecticola CBS 10117]|uniref:Uncharacterized protein n=1 Tax=Kwoniella dejecticola CBS 10117 TaxID=1296121 RepID=A0A1A6A8F0_9TREE|nr:uncharacterized protein I303_04055 [Kwoniella dejecticola CBS 10117]OBR86331.1 hypothetical protein I303_04055 [Kwoniella dejecticola CBS 10117]
MGISGLLPLLKEIQVEGHISAFKGKRLAVDAYVWLHKGAFGCAEELVKGKKTTKFVDYAMYRVRMLRYHGIKPYIVFDGGPLPAKKGTEVSRAKSREENLDRARSMESQGRFKEARDLYTKCVDITPEMAYQLIKALKAENVDYVVAPYEADAQLCYLEREGFVDGIITEDSDLLVFGCRQVIFKLDGDGKCVWIHRNNIATIRQFPMHGWTDVQFRRMAMLSGCDYLDSIVGIGLKKAHALMRRFKTVEKLLQHVRLEGSMTIPPDYLASFAQAELAFIHQRVYCPHQCRLIPLNDFPMGGLAEDDEKWIGLDVDQAIARGMATGDLHPETRIPIVDEWPDFTPIARSKPLGENFSEVNSAPAASGGPMDAFITRTKKAKPLPKPVGALGSGPSRLSDQVLMSTSAPALLSRAPPASSAGIKSKFFGKAKREVTPELSESLHWEEDTASEDVESQPIAGPSRMRSSPSNRSPSPAISSIRGEDSPAKSIRFGHVATSPGCILSSPPDSPSQGIPFSTPRQNIRRIREDTPPSPTGATAGGSFLLGASSQILDTDYDGEVKEELVEGTQVETPIETQTPLRKERKSLSSSRFSTIVIPNSSSPIGSKPFIPETQVLPHASTFRPFSSSSDTLSDEEQIITPSVDQVNQKKRKRVKQELAEQDENIQDNNEDPSERKSMEKAKVIANGWRAKYAFGQNSSSPVPSDDTHKYTRRSVSETARRSNSTKRPLMPISASASRILMARPNNIPVPSPTPSVSSTGSAAYDKYSTGAGKTKISRGVDAEEIGQQTLVPQSSSPVSSSASIESIFESTQPGGKTRSKLDKYRFGSGSFSSQ